MAGLRTRYGEAGLERGGGGGGGGFGPGMDANDLFSAFFGGVDLNEVFAQQGMGGGGVQFRTMGPGRARIDRMGV